MTNSSFVRHQVVYAMRHCKPSASDKHASIARCFAGGVYDLGANLCNIVYVTADVRNIQSSMVLTMSDFESSIVQPRTLQEFAAAQLTSEGGGALKVAPPSGPAGASGGGGVSGKAASSKDSYLTLTFKTELSELSSRAPSRSTRIWGPRSAARWTSPTSSCPMTSGTTFTSPCLAESFRRLAALFFAFLFYNVRVLFVDNLIIGSVSSNNMQI